jgi:hypothetical protein
MEEDYIGSQGTQWVVMLEKVKGRRRRRRRRKKKKKKKKKKKE